MKPASAKAQRGGAFGTLIVLALVAVGCYFLYVEFFEGGGRPPTCSEANQACIKDCRRSSTDENAIAACQKECQRKLDACK